MVTVVPIPLGADSGLSEISEGSICQDDKCFSLDDNDDKLDPQQWMHHFPLPSYQPECGWEGIKHKENEAVRDPHLLFLSYSLQS